MNTAVVQTRQYSLRMNPREKLQELINYCEQGVVTRSDIMWMFQRMLDEAGSDSSALELCENLPDWFRVELTKYIEELRDSDYFLMWTSSA